MSTQLEDPVWDIFENRWMPRHEWDEINAQVVRPRHHLPEPGKKPPPGMVFDIFHNCLVTRAQWAADHEGVTRRVTRR